MFEVHRFLHGKEIDVVGGVDRQRCAVDVMRNRNAAAQFGIILDVVDEQRGVVQHLDQFADGHELVVGNGEPEIECLTTTTMSEIDA